MTVRVAMWSGPRNISTAMMRAWENRPDTVVVDEPFYAAFLARTGLDHPARDEVIASQPTDVDQVVAGLLTPLPDGVSVHYAKHMTHHLAPGQDLTWARDFRNVLLIRDPAEVVASYVKSRESCEPDDIGLRQQVDLLDQLDEQPPVIDAADFLHGPRPICAGCATGSGSRSPTRCSRGRPARATPTASGPPTGTTPSGRRPASRPTDRARSTSTSTTPRSRSPAARPTNGSVRCGWCSDPSAMSIRHGLGLLLQDINTEGGDDDDHRTPSLGQSPPAGDRPPGAQRDLRLRPGARLLPPPPLPALRHVDRRPCRVRKVPRPRGECDTRTVTVRVAVCGRLTVNRDGESLSGPRLGTRKARVLTAALAAARGAPVSVDRLVEAVWGTTPPRDPQGNLATLASRLRRTAGDDLVVQAGAGYGLAPGVDLDLDAAAELHAAADARLRRREPTLAVAAAQRALSLLGGDGSLAEEFEDPWAEPLRREAAALAREARHLLVGAAVESGRADLAEQSARDAVGADPYDERAHRDLMTALAVDGQAVAALEVYAGLAARLADELGADPDADTQALHVRVLRHEKPPRSGQDAPAEVRPLLVGRDTELATLDRAWAAAAATGAELVVVAGVPGIGKTRLLDEAADLARRTGGLVLATRCRPGERSLFLQPYLEVLRPVLLSLPEDTLRVILGGHLPAWAGLLPDLGELLDVSPEPGVSGDLARRRAFDAVVAAVSGLATRQPVLLSVDDLQYGADVTAALLAHLATQLGPASVLLVGATRTEGLRSLSSLTERSAPLLLEPLPPSAVAALAAAAGFTSRSAEVLERSQGHPLSVVASLQALASGTGGVPRSVATAVAGQLERLDTEVATLVAAASVLGTRVDPVQVAGLVQQTEVDVVLACERAVGAGLMAAAGTHYDFVNDLVKDAVLATLPPPLAVAYHRRAADLLAGRPEEMAGHAHAAGDVTRAAHGYLVAGRTARRMAALDDALALLDLAEADATAAADPGLTATVLLERARVQEARADFVAAHGDVEAARVPVADARDPRLDMRRLRLLGGDLSVGRRLPLDQVVEHNRTGLARATELGDAVSAAMFRSRIAVLECSRLRLAQALEIATDGVARSRASGLPEALARSLDGLKAVHAYSGDAGALAAALDELLPLLDDLGLPWLRQWALLESALVPAAEGDWSGARRRVDEAFEVNRATGYAAYAAYFLAQRGWLARLEGDLDAAWDDGRRAVAELSPSAHPWWYATAVGNLATTLLELGRTDDVAALCSDGLHALGPEAGAAYRLRCLAPRAAVTGEGLEEADRLLAGVDAPPGGAWVSGSDVYEALATAWLNAGETDRAAQVTAPLLTATRESWQVLHERARQRTPATSAAARSAPSDGTSA